MCDVPSVPLLTSDLIEVAYNLGTAYLIILEPSPTLLILIAAGYLTQNFFRCAATNYWNDLLSHLKQMGFFSEFSRAAKHDLLKS